MSRPTGRIWFGKPSTGTLTAASSSSSNRPAAAKQQPPQRELAVVFEDIATYRAYKPGAGPRLRPVTLLPLRDTTAYVRDEFFVPHAVSHDGKKRLQYVVGWADLPAARLVVDAERVCDYVSPAAYEEWCAARAAERDEDERRREEEENVRAVAEAEAREKGIVLRNGLLKEDGAPLSPRKGRRPGPKKRGPAGRKGKVVPQRVGARTPPPPAETPGGEEDGGEKKNIGRPRKNAPSLSTPSKARLEQFRELETEIEPETEDTNDDDAIFRQLNGEGPSSAAEESYDSGLEPPRKKQRTVSPTPRLSRLIPGIETDSSRSTPFDSSRGATSSPALPPLPNPSQAGQPLPPSALPSIPPASAAHTSTPPAAPRTAVNPPRRSLLSLLAVRDPPSSPQPTSSSKAQTPTPKPTKLQPQSTAAPTLNLPLNGTTPPTSTPRTGFTPLAQSSTPWTHAARKPSSHPTPTQPIKSIEEPPPALPSTPTPRANPRPQRQQKPRDPDRDELAGAEDDDDERDRVYEVLRLEGLQIRDVRGKPVRFFAVRWKGSWPPGQNPTWEPEHNIPRGMTRKYLLAHPTPTRDKKTGAMDRYLSSPAAWSQQRKYSSVSEAFEGGGDDDADGAAAAAGEGADEDAVAEEEGEEEEEKAAEGADEMLLVTDEPGLPVQPTLSW